MKYISTLMRLRWSFRLSRVGSKFGALSLADSITCDPHRVYVGSYAAGAVLFKDASHNMIAN